MFCCSSDARESAIKKSVGNIDQPWMVLQKKLRKQNEHARVQQQELLLQKTIKCNNEFADITSSKIMFNEIQQLVNHAKDAQADDLEKKRNRLRTFLASEEETYEKEFQLKFNLKIDTDVKERETRLRALRSERDRAREDFVKQKRMQQMLERCDAIRPALRQKLIDDTKLSQMKQIEEKNIIKLAEKDFEAAWSEVSKNVYNQRIQREKDENRLSYLRNQCCALEQRQQIADRGEAIKRERIELRSNEPLFKARIEYSPEEEELKNLAKREQKVQNSLYLKEQQRQKKVFSEEQNAQDARIESMIMATVRSEIAKEKERQLENKQSMHKETLHYLEYLKKLEKERKLTENETDKLILEYNRKIDEIWNAKRCEVIIQQQIFAKSVHAERFKQITDRRQQRQEEHAKLFRAAVIENETATLNAKLDREASRKKHLDSIIYGKELLQQVESLNSKKKEELRKENDILQKIREEDQVCENFAQIYLSGEQDVLPILHPLTRIIRNSMK